MIYNVVSGTLSVYTTITITTNTGDGETYENERDDKKQ